jgi:type I restriction enzyme M protein
MPSGIFQPYSGVKTSYILFQKTNRGGTDNVWFYDMTADGYSLDAKRQPVSENDIADIITRFNSLTKESSRKRTDKSFLVPIEEIKKNEYDLSLNKYKQIIREEKIYRKTSEILREIEENQKVINTNIIDLKKILD